MKRIFLLLLVLAAPAAAEKKPGPRCPDGSAAKFSGHPFFPFLCSKSFISPKKGSGKTLLSAETMPTVKKEPKASFEPLLGRWEGWTFHGLTRFEVLASAEREKNRIILKMSVMDHAILRKDRFRGELKNSFWHPGGYDAVVTELDMPDSPLKALAWLGAAPAPAAEGLDRSFMVVFKRLAALHEVRFKFDGPDKIVYSYVYRATDTAPVQLDGTLTRSQRDPF